MQLTFPQFRGHRVKPLPSSLHTRLGSHSRGSSEAPPIIEHLDIFEDVLCRVFTGRVVSMIHELPLEDPAKAFDTSIVPAVACAAHAGDHAVDGEHLLITRGGILTAAIRVVQEPSPWGSIDQRHREGLLSQRPGQPVAHRPADHEARVQIENHGRVEPALGGPHVKGLIDP